MKAAADSGGIHLYTQNPKHSYLVDPPTLGGHARYHVVDASAHNNVSKKRLPNTPDPQEPTADDIFAWYGRVFIPSHHQAIPKTPVMLVLS